MLSFNKNITTIMKFSFLIFISCFIIFNPLMDLVFPLTPLRFITQLITITFVVFLISKYGKGKDFFSPCCNYQDCCGDNENGSSEGTIEGTSD